MFSVKAQTVPILNLNLNSLLVKRQIDNPSPGAVTGGNYSLARFVCSTRKPHYDISRALNNDEILFQNVFGHRESVNLRVREILITYCFCDFLFYGYPCTTIENMML